MAGKLARKLQEGRKVTVVVNVLPPKPPCTLKHEGDKHWAGGRLGWVKCDNS